MVDSFCQEKHQLTALYGTECDQEQQTQVQLTAQWALERFQECCETLGYALQTLTVTSRGVLASLWQDWRAAERTLNAFRMEHGVTRAAVYPESHLWHIAVLIGLAFVEALANMVFFARGAEGLLGGLLESLVVAAVNIATAFCAGISIRGVHSPSLMQRLLAGVVGLGYVAFLGLFHLAVAHYRVALVLDPDKAATVAMTRLMQQPWALADMYSCLLLVIGLLGATIAFLDGYKFDDPLPGYGAVWRQWKAAKAAYESLKHQYLTDIQMLTDVYLTQVDTRFDEAMAAMMAYHASVATTRRLIREYQEMIVSFRSARLTCLI